MNSSWRTSSQKEQLARLSQPDTAHQLTQAAHTSHPQGLLPKAWARSPALTPTASEKQKQSKMLPKTTRNPHSFSYKFTAGSGAAAGRWCPGARNGEVGGLNAVLPQKFNGLKLIPSMWLHLETRLLRKTVRLNEAIRSRTLTWQDEGPPKQRQQSDPAHRVQHLSTWAHRQDCLASNQFFSLSRTRRNKVCHLSHHSICGILLYQLELTMIGGNPILPKGKVYKFVCMQIQKKL